MRSGLGSREKSPDAVLLSASPSEFLAVAERSLRVDSACDRCCYAPNRKHAGRMRKMLYELQTSQDAIWQDVTAL